MRVVHLISQKVWLSLVMMNRKTARVCLEKVKFTLFQTETHISTKCSFLFDVLLSFFPGKETLFFQNEHEEFLCLYTCSFKHICRLLAQLCFHCFI